jgi:hypothetical protein
VAAALLPEQLAAGLGSTGGSGGGGGQQPGGCPMLITHGSADAGARRGHFFNCNF